MHLPRLLHLKPVKRQASRYCDGNSGRRCGSPVTMVLMSQELLSFSNMIIQMKSWGIKAQEGSQTMML